MTRAGQDLDRLGTLAIRQGGVVSPDDLAACGFSTKAVRHRIDEGTWHRVGGAIVLSPGHAQAARHSDVALSWILRFTFGPRARLSGVLALRHARWHLPCDAHIVVLDEKANHHLPGVSILRRPDTDVPVGPRGLRYVSPREALVDCLTVLSRPAATSMLDAALQKRYVPPGVIAEAIGTRLGRGKRNSAGLRLLLERATSGSRSEAEQRMARLLIRSGTGPWIPNHPLRTRQGQMVAEVDFAHLGLRIAIEVDGRAFHSDRQAFEHDRWRQNALMVDGWLVLRFTWEQIVARPDEVIAIIRSAVAQRAAS